MAHLISVCQKLWQNLKKKIKQKLFCQLPLRWISKARSDVIIIEHFLKITSSNLPQIPPPLSWIFPRSRHPGWDPTPCWWSLTRQKTRSGLEIEKLLNNHTEILILKLSTSIPRNVFVLNHKSWLYVTIQRPANLSCADVIPAFFGGKSSLKKSGLLVRMFGALGFSTSRSLEEELIPFLSVFVLMNRPSLYLPGFVSMTPTERRNVKSLFWKCCHHSHLQWGPPRQWPPLVGRR